jgi:hypothetical protein
MIDNQENDRNHPKEIKNTYSHTVLVNMADTAPAHAANVVLTAANAATSPRLLLLIKDAEPGLKPYHPNHKAKVPKNLFQKKN